MCDDERTRLNPKNGMSAEEAKKYLEHYVEILMDSNEDKKIKDTLFEIHVKAINALEKQIPKKPIADNYEGHIGKKCICGEQVWRHQKHCENCGQLQDWSDDNDE